MRTDTCIAPSDCGGDAVGGLSLCRPCRRTAAKGGGMAARVALMQQALLPAGNMQLPDEHDPLSHSRNRFSTGRALEAPIMDERKLLDDAADEQDMLGCEEVAGHLKEARRDRLAELVSG